MRERILLTCFKPFGFTRMIFGINPSEITGKVLFRYARKKDLDVYLLILPVNNNCVRIVRKYIDKLKPNRIFMLGQGDNLRIERFDSTGRISNIAEVLKYICQDKNEDNIGDYYCEKVYRQAMNMNNKVVFIHIPLMHKPREKERRLKEIFDEFLRLK